MRKLLLSLLLFILAVSLAAGALAESASLKNEETGFEAVIDDPAGLLTKDEMAL